MIFKCCDPKTNMLPNKTYPKIIAQVAFIPSGASITTIHNYSFTELTIRFHEKNFYVYGCGVNQEVSKLFNILAGNPDIVVIADIFKKDGNNYTVGKTEVIKNRGTKRSLYEHELIKCSGFREISLVRELPQNTSEK